MLERLRPDYTRSPSLEELTNAHSSAEEALEAGDHYIALVKSRQEGRKDLEAAALLMCGAVGRVMTSQQCQDDIRTYPHLAYGAWCQRDTETAALHLEGQDQFQSLIKLLRQSAINVFMIAAPHTRHGIPSQKLPGFRIESVILEALETPLILSELIPLEFKPDAIFVLDVYGARLPDDLYEFEGPIIFLSYDFDLQLPHQSEDLQRADLHIVNSGYEHFYSRHLYATPVSGFPTFALTFDPLQFSKSKNNKDIDFLHTGLSFTPTMREKAQFLFRVSTIDNPNLKIKIHHGFLSNDEYRESIGRTKWMPTYNPRLTGGVQSRSMDALCNGAALLHGESDHALELFEAAKPMLHPSTPESLWTDMAQLSEEPIPDPGSENLQRELLDFFPSHSERIARFIKFGIFEWGRRSYQRPKQTRRRTTSVVGFNPNLDEARLNTDQTPYLFAQAHYRAIESVIQQPLDEDRRSRVISIFEETESFNAVTLSVLFNQARYLWMIGDRENACAHFKELIESAAVLLFDPRRELVFLRFFEASSEMFPVQDYALAVCQDQVDGANLSRDVICATAETYLGLSQLQLSQFEPGLEYLNAALSRFSNHFPAARLKFKALHALNRPPSEVAEAFDHAVNCYPPVINELLPFAVSSELEQGREEEALSLIKTWTYFITRCTWDAGKEPAIPNVTFKSVSAFMDRLPENLQTALKERFPGQLGAG